MKKLMAKDKKIRTSVKNYEKIRFMIKTVNQNLNFNSLVRWNLGFNIKKLPKQSSKTKISNRCILTINKKRLNKLSNFSRMTLLEKIRSGTITGIQKSVW